MMIKRIVIYLMLLLVFTNFIDAKDLNIYSLENEIIKYNRAGKQKLSQEKLSSLLFSDNLTNEEKANVLFFMAATYRSVNDYTMCIDYLNRSNIIAKGLPESNILKMKLDYEYAFVYFDNNEYEKCDEIMKRIASKKYPHTIPEDNSYILMQEGYLFFRNKEFSKAEKKYKEALAIMEIANYCNLPIVYVKLMELYNKKKDVKKAEDIYFKSMELSKNCGILKYETYAASEMEKIYKENNMLKDAYSVSLKLDSLRKLEGVEERVSEMHLMDKKFLEKRVSSENVSFFRLKILAAVIVVIFICVVIFYFFRYKNLKIEKIKMEEELRDIENILNSYFQNKKTEGRFTANDNFDKLTERQKDLLELMADGLSNKEIADKLFITESTVKYHIKNIYNVLDLKNRKDFFKKLGSN